MGIEEATAEERAAATARNMEAAGVSSTTPVQADYFGFDESETVMLPDGISWIQHKKLNEGARREYLNKINRDVKLQRSTGDAIVRMASGDEKHALLVQAISGWNLMRNGQPVTFSKGSPGAELEKFLIAASPAVVDLIEKAVRKANPWLLQELTIEEIDKQITELEEMREQKLKEESGKDF